MKQHFPHINLLRFVAALLIVVHHVEQCRADYGIANHWDNPIVHNLGHIGVTLFFVLSGFLVAHSLIEQGDGISIKRCYRRRALRILPLYFLLIVLSVGCFQFIPYLQQGDYRFAPAEVLCYALLLPNLAITLFTANSFVAHTWFIGSLEQVQLLLPPIFKRVKRPLLTIGVVIGVYWLLGGVLKLTLHCEEWYEFWHYFNVDSIFIGAAAAVIFHHHPRAKQVMLSPYVCYTALVALLVLILSGWVIPFCYTQVLALLFAVLLMNLVAAKEVRCCENAVTTFLGNISYALFLFHPICIVALLPIGAIWHPALFYAVALSASLLVATALHYAVELPIKRRKT